MCDLDWHSGDLGVAFSDVVPDRCRKIAIFALRAWPGLEMADTNSVGVILDFLRRNQFTRAEAALRSELNNLHDLNGFLQELTLEEKAIHDASEKDKGKSVLDNRGLEFHDNDEVSRELIVKEIECGAGRNLTGSKCESTPYIGERKKSNEVVGARDTNFTFPKSSEDSVLDLYSWKLNPSNGPVEPYQNDDGSGANNTFKALVSQKSKHQTSEVLDMVNRNTKSGEENTTPSDNKSSRPGSSSRTSIDQSYVGMHAKEPKELDRQPKSKNSSFKENFADNTWLRTDENENSSSDLWKDCSVKTVFPFSKGDIPTTYNGATYSGNKEENRKELFDIRAAMKAQVDEVGRAIYAGKSQGSSEKKTIGSLSFPVAPENQKEEFPRLPPVKLKSEDKSLTANWEEKLERHGPASKLAVADSNLLIGSYLDVPVGQEINPTGMKRAVGGSWLSVSQGIAEDTSDLVSGFATIGNGLGESVDYPNEYWDSDEYDDDDDVGYMRQPIEDEAWFLAHEIDYPSDNEKATGHGSVPDPQDRSPAKEEDDDQSFAEEDSYFSGEQYVHAKNVEPVLTSDDPIGLTITEMYGRTNENELMAQYDGQLMDEEELNLMCTEPVWQGFVSQTNELVFLGDGKTLNDGERLQLEDIYIDDDHHSSVRSIGVGINSDAVDIGSEVRESFVGGSSEGDLEYLCDRDIGVDCSKDSLHELDKKSLNKLNKSKKKNGKSELNKYVIERDKGSLQMNSHTDGNFSFPQSLKDGQVIQPASSKPLRSNNCNADENDDCLNAFVKSDDMLTSWRQKSSDSSPIKSSRDENNTDAVRSTNSSPITVSNYGYAERVHVQEEDEKVGIAGEEDLGASLEDEEAAAVQEQLRQIKAQEEEFETFNLKIVHRKNRHVTGFEEDKNFHVVLNSVIAGRYHVTEYLGSAAFSKAIQAHDLHTGMDVCVKIIKNNKDFFDQSLDEIKLLKYVNKHDPADKYHILRLYDYFYYRFLLYPSSGNGYPLLFIDLL
ncbi:Dual specificity tyrosine-phosphorylation-regulated kinase 4 isoform B [Senna tora]|uniref:Dual specificity tyrosine-phosphorylation-regulated kinase 4 isoform B n=1 Tax=Senna tora TaxID=362788 RepID=A0A834TB10_9FABA|nr:Dual specificity tyrosine-phosphorylation-regulated kinase 4 isoform B [Senna tora]